MDLLAHAVYGATVFSRIGLAGGRTRRTGRRWFSDWTIWVAALFGVLPDILSMGPPFLAFVLAGMPDNFFHAMDHDALVSYRILHSLLVSLAAAGILRLVWKPLFLPSLAWPLHVFMDALTHGAGKFQTTVFYPLSTWGFEGIRWWEHAEVILIYWLLLPALWMGLWLWRRSPVTAGESERKFPETEF